MLHVKVIYLVFFHVTLALVVPLTDRGRVVGVTVSNPKRVYSYNTSANKGAIWAPGGPAGDGSAVFVGTGNTEGTSLLPQLIVLTPHQVL